MGRGSMYLRLIIGFTAMFAVFGYAQWRGGRTERVVSWAMLAAYLATPLGALLSARLGPRYGVFAIDVLLACFILVVALRSAKAWPMWAAGFMWAEVVMHLTIMVDRSVLPTAYIVAVHFWSYFVLLTLAVGTWSADRSRRLRGGDVAA